MKYKELRTRDLYNGRVVKRIGRSGFRYGKLSLMLETPGDHCQSTIEVNETDEIIGTVVRSKTTLWPKKCPRMDTRAKQSPGA